MFITSRSAATSMQLAFEGIKECMGLLNHGQANNIEDGLEHIESLDLTSLPDILTNANGAASKENIPSLVAPTDSSLDATDADETLDASEVDSVLYQTDIVATSSTIASFEKCGARCTCRCHVRNSARSPWLFETLLGRANLEYTYRRWECDEKKCMKAATPSLTFTYYLPRFLFTRYVTFKLNYLAASGPQFSLRFPRITPWTHPYWSYAKKGDLKAIQNLYSQQKASPFDTRPDGGSSIMYTAIRHDHKTMQFMMDQGADLSVSTSKGMASELLLGCLFAGHLDREGTHVASKILHDCGHLETQGYTILHKIVLGIVNRDMREELEVSTASINVADARGRTPLNWAVVRDDFKAVETLLEYGADPNAYDNMGYPILCHVKSKRVCKAILQAGADKNGRGKLDGQTAMHVLYDSHEPLEILEVSIAAGVPIDAQDSNGETALTNLGEHGLTTLAERLIELGADVNISNKSLRANALHGAVWGNHHQIIPQLLAAGVDYNATMIDGQNIAHIAALTADTETVKVLAASDLVGLDLLREDKDGKTPMNYIAEREIFSDSENGIHEAFQALVQSVFPQPLEDLGDS